MPKFMFATGIENSYPTIRLPDGSIQRVDEMAKCRHYENWRLDFQLCKDLGIGVLRYGPPMHKTYLAPGRYDWSFADETFNALQEMEIVPIADLCHFGVSDWLENFQNPEFPRFHAEYARAFAERYPWVKLFTPVNEIYIAADYSGQKGWWNERLTTDAGFVTAMKHLCQANVRAMHAILKAQPDAVFIQSEASQYFHTGSPGVQDKADFLNEKRFIALDLSYGHEVSASIYKYLLDNGLTRDEYDWFQNNHLRERCIMGNDYYGGNEYRVEANGGISHPGSILGYYVITHQYFARYRMPVMHTETNLMGNDKAPDWLAKEWANLHRLRRDGVPLLGFTWYSLTDQVDWDTALRENNGTVNPLGLYDLDRNIRPVGTAYGKLIREWQDFLPTNDSTFLLFQQQALLNR